MSSENKILAIILARSGSKRLPKKNLKLFGDKPLISWTIECALNSKYLDKVFVSTDSEDIKKVSIQFGASCPFIRPSRLSGDDVTSEDAVQHAIRFISDNFDYKYNHVMLLQPTSPLRTSEDINRAVEYFYSNKNANSLVSVTNIEKNINWYKVLDKSGMMKNLLPEEERQEVYIPNGAIYFSSIDTFLKDGTFYTSKTLPFIMNKAYSIDIDNELDFFFADSIRKNYER